jgi:predicted  nucleic acid-binding Zn-ribbon protein
VLSGLFDDAVTQASALVANPDNSTLKSLLTADLTNIQKTLNLVNIFITGTQNSIAKFGSQTLSDAATSLELVAYDAYEDYQIDQQKIDDLKKQIKNLQDEIASLAAEIGINAALVAAELTVGWVFAASLGPAGLILIGCSVAASATVIALDAIQLEKDQAALQQAQAALSSTEQDAAALQNTSDSFTTLANQTTALDTSIAGISSAWQALESDMTAAITDVNKAIAENKTTDFQDVYADLVAAQEAWNDAYSASTLLHVNVQGNPAQMNVSMSQSQVTRALNEDPTVDFVTYINNFPQPTNA